MANDTGAAMTGPRGVNVANDTGEGHLVRIDEGRSLGADRGWKVTW